MRMRMRGNGNGNGNEIEDARLVSKEQRGAVGCNYVSTAPGTLHFRSEMLPFREEGLSVFGQAGHFWSSCYTHPDMASAIVSSLFVTYTSLIAIFLFLHHPLSSHPSNPHVT